MENTKQALENLLPVGSLAYELGILFFQVASNHPKALRVTNEYDMTGSWTHLLSPFIEAPLLQKLRSGFIAECHNHDIPYSEAARLFEDTFNRIYNEV